MLPFQLPLLECVPNFSEGGDAAKMDAIAQSIRATPGAHLLDVDASPAANRTVMTIAGAPEAVTSAAFSAICTAARLIDMRTQQGVHPRIGATDVCPFIPLAGMSMEAADACAQALGRRVGAELGIPVYLYEASQQQPHRRALPHIRRGHYEGFAQKMQQPGWAPDYGPATFNAATGATVIGARKLLVAFNVSLDTADFSVAAAIAKRLRSVGFSQAGRLPGTRAIGWYMADYQHAQVSFNLLDYTETSPLAAYEACRALAAEAGVALAGSELIGLMPEACLLEAGAFHFAQHNSPAPTDAALLVQAGIAHLGLARLKPFVATQKVLEYALRHAGLADGGWKV